MEGLLKRKEKREEEMEKERMSNDDNMSQQKYEMKKGQDRGRNNMLADINQEAAA